jgi:hypothetical protein
MYVSGNVRCLILDRAASACPVSVGDRKCLLTMLHGIAADREREVTQTLLRRSLPSLESTYKIQAYDPDRIRYDTTRPRHCFSLTGQSALLFAPTVISHPRASGSQHSWLLNSDVLKPQCALKCQDKQRASNATTQLSTRQLYTDTRTWRDVRSSGPPLLRVDSASHACPFLPLVCTRLGQLQNHSDRPHLNNQLRWQSRAYLSGHRLTLDTSFCEERPDHRL